MKDKQNSNSKNSFPCPECDNPIIHQREIKTGTIIECSACGTQSEFISINPLKLAPLEEEK